MTQLNPQPDFDSATGLSLANTAFVASGQLALPAQSDRNPISGPATASWTSPETLTKGYYRYDIAIVANGGVDDQAARLYVGGAMVPLYGTGVFQGVIYTHATNQLCIINTNDPSFTAKLSHCSIERV